MAMLVIFLVGPILTAFYGSFTNLSLTGAEARNSTWVGLKNYSDLFASPGFSNSVLLTIVFVLVSAVIGQNVIGMALALLMRSGSRAVAGVVGTIVIGAWALPDIVGAFAAYAVFSKDGTINALLASIGITGPSWLFTYPMFAVIVANIWRGAAFSMLMFTAAIQEVPEEITEAATVDGASATQRFFRVIVPQISGSIWTTLMLTTLGTLSVFTLIFVMTGGGPGDKSMTLPILAYFEGFRFFHLGLGNAVAVVLLIIGLGFSVVYLRALKQRVE